MCVSVWCNTFGVLVTVEFASEPVIKHCIQLLCKLFSQEMDELLTRDTLPELTKLQSLVAPPKPKAAPKAKGAGKAKGKAKAKSAQ